MNFNWMQSLACILLTAWSGTHAQDVPVRQFIVDADGLLDPWGKRISDFDLFSANWQGRSVDLGVNETRPVSAQPRQAWTYLQIDKQRASRKFGIGWGDVDRDRDMDIASGQYIYINPGGDMRGRWQRITLPGHVDANFITDVDGDERADILAQDLPNIYWLEASDAAGTSYSARIVASGLGVTGHGSSQGFALGEVIGGGAPEYVLAAGDGIHYLRIPADPSSDPWPTVHITDQAPEEGLALGDVDGDGLNDVVAWIGSGSGSRQLGWWKNPGKEIGNWTLYRIGNVDGDEGDRVALGDFNQDGKIDVAATGTTNSDRGSSVYWFDNPGQPTTNNSWIRITIGSDLGAMNSMSTADIDQDGALDVITGEHRGSKRMVVWRNRKSGTEWSVETVDIGRESHLGAQVADLDNDGDLDIMSIGWDDFQTFHLWRNDTRRQPR